MKLSIPLRIAAVLFALSSALHPKPGRSEPVQPAPAVQMAHISVQTLGRGSPVILIPGLASPRATWDGLAPVLAEKHTVLLVQVNGFGGDAPGDNLKPGLLDGIVADLDRLIRDRKLDRPAIIGHSMGGLVGLMLASRHPEHVGRLMTVDALPFFAATMAPPGTTMTAEMVAPRAAQMRDAVAAGYGKPANRAAAEANVAGMTLHADLRPRLVDWAMAADPRVMAAALYEDLTTDMRPALATLKVPVTAVYAWNDSYPRKEPADAFFRQQFAGTPRATFVGIGPSAHFVMLDQPAAFQAAVESFLAK